MNCIWVHLDEGTHQKLLRKSKRKKIGMSTYIRELLHTDLNIRKKPLRRPWLGKNVRHLKDEKISYHNDNTRWV